MAPHASLRNLFAYASNLLSQLPLSLDIPNPLSLLDLAPGPAPSDVVPYIPLSGAPSCPIDGPLSCHNSTPGDSCCFVHPGGRVLMTQFWDQAVHAGGAEEDWTVHGLWYVPFPSGAPWMFCLSVSLAGGARGSCPPRWRNAVS